jgi:flagellar biosynthesis protein
MSAERKAARKEKTEPRKETKLAVALQYDRKGAPRVTAKGRGAIGTKIVEVAKAHDIPIEENEVLAGALSNVELGDEIPVELYRAVAEVLVFVLKLTRAPH